MRHCITRPLRERPALVVEGGGMRGVYSVSALEVLEERGLRDAFSRVVASSAGALNGAYFLSRQACEGIQVYTEDLSSRAFVNFARPHKVVDIDFLIDVAMKQRHPFRIDQMRTAPADLNIVVTELRSGRPRVVAVQDQSLEYVYELLRATSALPVLYRRAIMVDGTLCVDGGVSSQVPLYETWQAGAAAALVILTKCRGHRRLTRGVPVRLLTRATPGLPAAIKQRIVSPDAVYNQIMDELDREETLPKRITWTLRPSDNRRLVTLAEHSRAKLRETASLAREDMLTLLGRPAAAQPGEG